MWTNENRARYDRSKLRYPSGQARKPFHSLSWPRDLARPACGAVLAIFSSRSAPEEDEQSTLVFEMDGLVSDEQADETVQQDTAGQTQQTAQAAAQAQQTPPQEQQPIEDDGAPVQANTVVAAGEAGARRGHKGEWRRGATDRPHDRAS